MPIKDHLRVRGPEDHYDTAIALALAVERARRYTPVTRTIVGRPTVSFDTFEGDVREWFEM